MLQVSANGEHNAHLFAFLLKNSSERDRFMQFSRDQNVQSIFHYVPLHSAPAAKKYASSLQTLPVTEDLSSRLVRIPLWLGVNKKKVIDTVYRFFGIIDNDI